MKYLMILTVGVCILFASVPAMADQAEDETAIRKEVEKMAALSNKHDAEALGAPLTEDYENWTGSQKGRAAYVKNMSNLYDLNKDRQVKLLDEIGIVFVTPDVAIFKGRLETSGLHDADGKPLPPSKRLQAWIFVKKSGQWLRAASFSRPIEE